MVYRTTPQLGQQLEDVGANYWDELAGITVPSPKPGTREIGSDGAEYFFVTASAEVSGTSTTGTEVDLTYPGYTVAPKQGTGGYWTPPGKALEVGQTCWVRKGAAWNAAPGS